MMRSLVFFISLVAMFFAPVASAVKHGDNNYFEVCLESTSSCAVGVITQLGDFAVLIPEGQPLPGGMLLGDVFKYGPKSIPVARLRTALYQHLKGMGLERMTINQENPQKELDGIQDQLNESLMDCLLASAACTGGGLLALGTGPLGLAVAGVVCWQSYRQCKTLDKANDALFAQRKELERQLKEKKAKEKKEKEGSSGGGEGGQASGANPGGMEVPPIVYGPLPGGKISGSEGSGGSGGHKPIIFN